MFERNPISSDNIVGFVEEKNISDEIRLARIANHALSEELKKLKNIGGLLQTSKEDKKDTDSTLQVFLKNSLDELISDLAEKLKEIGLRIYTKENPENVPMHFSKLMESDFKDFYAVIERAMTPEEAQEEFKDGRNYQNFNNETIIGFSQYPIYYSNPLTKEKKCLQKGNPIVLKNKNK